jgi:osmotically-inducible protein OsmY
MPLYVLAGAIGAAIAYLFDPDSGRRRRKILADKAGKFARQGGQRAQDAAAQGEGMKQKATHLKEQKKPQPDDVTLARKVEAEIFRDSDVPKGEINVNAEDGVVYLRGEVTEPDMIEDLEAKARNVQGVLGVENLLHAPGQEAPAKPE